MSRRSIGPTGFDWQAAMGRRELADAIQRANRPDSATMRQKLKELRKSVPFATLLVLLGCSYPHLRAWLAGRRGFSGPSARLVWLLHRLYVSKSPPETVKEWAEWTVPNPPNPK